MNTERHMARMTQLAAAATAKPSHNVTSQCLEIADFTHEDCTGGYCRCECHKGATS